MNKLNFAFAAAILLAASTAQADTSSFGGYSARFKGAGDKIPPECQVDLPRGSGEPFFIKWNCADDNAEREDIRTELWIYRKGAPTGERLKSFIGFPAAVKIDEGVLGVTKFTDGLPLQFRLVAMDLAGITAISPLLTVQVQDNSVSQCDLKIVAQATESTGGTTGLPESTVSAQNAAVQASQSSASNVSIVTTSAAEADPCEIESVCENDSKVTFRSPVTIASDNSATAKITVSPGALLVELSGSAEVKDAALNSLSLTGTTEIEGREAEVTLTCGK
jgi:hypothetical protein